MSQRQLTFRLAAARYGLAAFGPALTNKEQRKACSVDSATIAAVREVYDDRARHWTKSRMPQ